MKDTSIVTAWIIPASRLESLKRRVSSTLGTTYLRTIVAGEDHVTIMYRWSSVEALDTFVEKLLCREEEEEQS